MRLRCNNCDGIIDRNQTDSTRFCAGCFATKLSCDNCDEIYDPKHLQCPNCRAPQGWLIHDPWICKGERCIWHNPTDHSMRHLPFILRETGLVERLCPCGVGHPDPDSVDWLTRTTGQQSWGIHGCCSKGCCFNPDPAGKTLAPKKAQE